MTSAPATATRPAPHTAASPAAARRGGIVAHRKALAASAVALAALVSGSLFYLGATGSTTTSISPPAGAPSSTAAAQVTPVAGTIQRRTGQALKQVGILLAKVTTAASTANHLKVSVDWLDPNDAGRVLNNPNAQLSIGLYHDVHTGACNQATSYTVTNSPTSVTLTDPTDGATYCALLDTSATGSSTVSTGALFLSKEDLSSSGDSVLCTANTTNDADTPCDPSYLASNLAERVLYVGLSIVTPGGNPHGQQPQAGSLSFFVRANATG